MRKFGSGRFHKQDDILVHSITSLDSGFTANDYQQIKKELSDLHNRLKPLLEKLVYADAPEYFRLAKIVDISLEELLVKIDTEAVSEFPKPSDGEIRISHENVEDDSEITWKDLCRVEPELIELWSEAKEVKDNPRRGSFCTYDYFSDHFADRLMELLGNWIDNQNPKLRSMKSLDLAKNILIDTLPPCRNCKKHAKLEVKADNSV